MGPELRNQKSIARRVLRSKYPLFLEYKSGAENKSLTLMINAKKKFRSLGMLLKKEGEEDIAKKEKTSHSPTSLTTPATDEQISPNVRVNNIVQRIGEIE